MIIIITITKTMKDAFICNRNPVFISKKETTAILVVKCQYNLISLLLFTLGYHGK